MAKPQSSGSRNEQDEKYPFWHMKRQKGYKLHRALMVVQIIMALLLSAVILWGMRTLGH
jgi:hypothetical protein